MPLDKGTRIGPYEILGPLGAGGMGEVYRARDSKLHREVALKVLPATLSGDPEYLARFQREAQALAALNRSNIAQIYGIESDAIVMELVQGHDLREPFRSTRLSKSGTRSGTVPLVFFRKWL
jgi:serine/threonine protein kinase